MAIVSLPCKEARSHSLKFAESPQAARRGSEIFTLSQGENWWSDGFGAPDGTHANTARIGNKRRLAITGLQIPFDRR
jgi:hypothetical protein